MNDDVVSAAKELSPTPGWTVTTSENVEPLITFAEFDADVGCTGCCTVTVNGSVNGVPPIRLLQAESEQARNKYVREPLPSPSFRT